MFVFEGNHEGKKTYTSPFIPIDHEWVNLTIKVPAKIEKNQKLLIGIFKVLDSKILSKGYFEVSLG